VAVGDPAESLSPTVMPGARGRVARALLSGSMRILCRRAAIVRYVTATILQTRYPPGAESTVIAGSDIGELHPQAVANPADDGHVVVVTVASLDQPYKGVQELIDAVARIRGQGWNVTLRVAGTGRLLHTLRTHGRDALGDAVEFTGHLDPPDLDRFLQAAHVFVLPSWTEGLPRALVEAMGNGLPCIASDVGGNRELLTSKHLFAPRSTNELTLALSELLHDREGWEAMGRRNVERAAEVARGGELANRDFARAAAQMVGSRR